MMTIIITLKLTQCNYYFSSHVRCPPFTLSVQSIISITHVFLPLPSLLLPVSGWLMASIKVFFHWVKVRNVLFLSLA